MYKWSINPFTNPNPVYGHITISKPYMINISFATTFYQNFISRLPRCSVDSVNLTRLNGTVHSVFVFSYVRSFHSHAHPPPCHASLASATLRSEIVRDIDATASPTSYTYTSTNFHPPQSNPNNVQKNKQEQILQEKNSIFNINSLSVLYTFIAKCLLKAGIAELEQTAVDKQWPLNTFPRQPNHLTDPTDTHEAIEELLDAAFSVGSMPRLHKQNQLEMQIFTPCGGGYKYLYRSLASRRRRRKRSSVPGGVTRPP
jgi:hypothetical protein